MSIIYPKKSGIIKTLRKKKKKETHFSLCFLFSVTFNYPLSSSERSSTVI